jgi:HSP20 family molecular chaperone IbpA
MYKNMNRELTKSRLEYASKKDILYDLIFPFENYILREGKNLMANSFNSDLKEDQNCYYINAELPGFNKDEIELEVDTNRVIIHAEKKKKEDVDKKNHLSEITYGFFSRTFSFSHSVEIDSTKATYENGILNIKLNKTIDSKISKINIE